MFLTLEDPRAKVQGSRDPLGIGRVWASFGRRIVGNLTTVTNDVRSFTVHLLGRYYSERLIHEGKLPEKDALRPFLHMEQIGAYARHCAHGVDGGVRGIDRVRRNLGEGRSVPIHHESGTILSDQKTYGLWGLFTVPARRSGLVADGPVGLTPEGRAFVEREYLPKLRKCEDRLTRLLVNGGELDTARNASPFREVASVLGPTFTPAELRFYAETLRDGRHVSDLPAGRQALAAELLLDIGTPDAWLGREQIETFARRARERGDERLAERVAKIARAEALLALVESIFAYLQVREGQALGDVARSLRDRWGTDLPHLRSKPFEWIRADVEAAVGPVQTELMARCDHALATADYDGALRTLLDWNRVVMESRNAGPWVRLEGGKLDVRYSTEETDLPTADELPRLWRFTYFLDALKDVTFQLARPV